MIRRTLAALLLVAACSGGRSEDTPADTAAAAPVARPQQVTDTLHLEGMPEPVALQLFTAPADFPLQFSTYLPPGIAAEPLASGDTASIRFSARFTPGTDPNVYMHLLVYPASQSLEQLEEMVLRFIDSREPIDREYARTQPPAWAEDAWTFRYGSGARRHVGSIVFGRRDGHAFSIITHYPSEYGDGFPPRTRLILRHWQWQDGTPLQRNGTP